MYTFDSRIRYSECSSRAQLSLEGLIDYFQDASTFHSEDLGLGIDYLKKEKLVWVLSAWQIEVERYPLFGEKVTVGTFPYDFKGCFGHRNFFLKESGGSFLAKANSLWTLLDLENKRPVRPNSLMTERYVLEEKLEMNYASRKIDVPDGGKEGEPIVIRRSHLDTNGHVNNGQYVRMAMESLPTEFAVGSLRAEYKKQALLGDVIHPCTVETADGFIVSLRDMAGTAYANVEMKAYGMQKHRSGGLAGNEE